MADFSLSDIDSMIEEASQGYDFSNYFTGGGEPFDFGSFDLSALSFDDADNLIGSGDFDFGQLDPNAFSLDDIDNLINEASSGVDFSNYFTVGGEPFDLTKGADLGGLGLKATGRGQLSLVDPETGATGLTAEGFRNVQDLLGSGTAEEIARYTPGTADYSIRSGLETEGGQGLSADATRGMGLSSMGGAQGIGKYIPAEYGGSVLEDLIRQNPGQFGAIEDYLADEVFGGKGLQPFKGTGGTLSAAGFLQQSSKENPLGAKYATGMSSRLDRPSVSGQQASVAPGRTVIDNKDGTYDVVTENKDGSLTRKTVDQNGNTVSTGGKAGSGSGTKTGTGTGGQQKSDLSSLLPLLLMLLAMNRGGGGSSGASSAVIPALTATQRQTPYTQTQQAAGYRPGQGGITYFDPVQYSPRMAAGGGIASLDRGRLLDGPGDGVSDSIPAVIGGMAGGGQPARLARGEYVMDARTVAALGNGSTDAGAERLDEMRKKVLATDRKAKVGADSKAYKHLKV